MIIGILALQGAFQKHFDALAHCGVRAKLVKTAQDLKACDGLLIPGGESTVISKQWGESGLFEAVRLFSEEHPIMGTCAGMVLMGKCEDPRVLSLDLIPIEVERNAYGPQVESFVHPIEVCLPGKKNETITGIFIRAPQISHVGDDVEVLAKHRGVPVLLIYKQKYLVCSFHPELSDSLLIHQYFLSMLESFPSLETISS